jgi:hypothetical protein
MRVILVAVLTLAAGPGVALGRSILTCRDGVLSMLTVPGTVVHGACDDDETVNGVCTFRFADTRQGCPAALCSTAVVVQVRQRAAVPIRVGRFHLRCLPSAVKTP